MSLIRYTNSYVVDTQANLPVGQVGDFVYCVDTNVHGTFNGVSWQFPASTLYRATALATVANTTTASSIIGTSTKPSDSLTLPPNFLTMGKQLRFTIRGLFSTAGITPGNLTLVDKMTSGTSATVTTLATGTASSLLIGASNQGFSGELIVTCFGTGTTGSLMVMGAVTYTTGLTTAPLVIPLNNGTSTVTIDTTQAQTFGSSVQWASASASNTISSMIATLESLN